METPLLGTVGTVDDNQMPEFPFIPLSELGQKMIRDTFEYLYVRAMVNPVERKLLVPALSACHLLATCARSPDEDLRYMKNATVIAIDAFHSGDDFDEDPEPD